MFGETLSEKAIAEALVNVTEENSQEGGENIPFIEIKEVVVIHSSNSLSSPDCKYETREAIDRQEYEDVMVAVHQEPKFVYGDNGTTVEGDSGLRREEGVSELEIEPHSAPVNFEAVVESKGTTITSSGHSVVETMVDEVTSQQITQGGHLYNLCPVFTF